MSRNQLVASIAVLSVVLATGAALATFKYTSIQESAAQAANQPEPMEVVTASTARKIAHRNTTTSIGTITALRSITLRNEVPGTVRQVNLTPGRVVEAGTVLVVLDISVEEAEIAELEARAALAGTFLERLQSANENRSISQVELDRARAELDIARAQIARTRAIIARKTIRAPFRAVVGISDVHPGQYLSEGTNLTTLQGVDDSVYVDFAVAQQVAERLRRGDAAEVFVAGNPSPIEARIVAVDARVDPSTRNAVVRARLTDAANAPHPGASARVQVPSGPAIDAVAVPVSALRKGPAGDHVFVVAADDKKHLRARLTPVVSGPVLGEEVLILSGLNDGDSVATLGSFKLRDQALVALSGK
ncbi:MAG TPA: efflux RND transporter periplasmic adaptor subunit [Thermoanaerobaculia bacterium]